MFVWLVQVSRLKTVQPNRFLVCFGLIKLLADRERFITDQFALRLPDKMGCLVRIVVVSILPDAEFELNDHREDAPNFKICDHEKTVDYEKCIYIFSLADATDHASANRMCESSLVRPTGDCPDCKGTLVSIHNKETNDFVANSIINSPDHTEHPHWIGLRYVFFHHSDWLLN